MRFLSRAVPVSLVVACLSVGLLAFTSTASANEGLLGELPGGHDTVVLVDFSQMRGYPLYDQVFQMLGEHPALSGVLTYMEDDLGIDLKSDVDTLALSTDTPPLSAELLNQPMAALDGSGSANSEGSLILVRGSLDAESVLQKLAEDSEHDVENNRLPLQSGEMRILDSRTLAIIAGSDNFVAATARKLDGDRSGPGSEFTRGISRLGSAQGIYAMVRPTIKDDVELDAEPSFTAFSLDLKDQVRIALLLDLPSESDAEAMVQEVDQIRKEFGGNPLASMFGAKPLIDNLSLRQNGKEFSMRTSMTNDEAIRLVTQLYSLSRSSEDLSRPIGGDRFKTDDDAGSDSSSDGVDADFN
jgi:hypothetical protein